jgi:hypothetical protein
VFVVTIDVGTAKVMLAPRALEKITMNTSNIMGQARKIGRLKCYRNRR